MKVLTVSREYGAGGGEVARRLAETLGWELLDRELLHRAAALEHVPDAELERLDETALPLADHLRRHPPHQRYLHGLTEVVRQAADRGRVVLVGRGTRQLLGDTPEAFHLRLVAPREWRVQRMARLTGCSLEQAQTHCAEVNHSRDRFTRYFFGSSAQQPAQYDLVANGGRVPLEDVVAVVAAVVRSDAEASPSGAVVGPRVLTLARELGAGDTGFARTLGVRLGLSVWDRELLEHEAARLGVTEAALERIDEHPTGLFDRFRRGSLPRRYFEALAQLLNDLADRGNVLLVGRGSSQVLRDRPWAFHVRLMSPLDVRVRRVMEHRWVREAPARQLIAESDSQRSAFHRDHFRTDWASPLEYHLSVNSGRLGPTAVDLVALAAGRHWQRAGAGLTAIRRWWLEDMGLLEQRSWPRRWLAWLVRQKMLLVMLGGAIGSYLRYRLGTWFNSQPWTQGLPYGTLVINVSGSFILAAAATLLLERLPPQHQGWYLLIGTGFCGGYTTFSTFEWETFRLVRDGSWWYALANVLGSVVAGFVGVVLAVTLVNALFSE